MKTYLNNVSQPCGPILSESGSILMHTGQTLKKWRKYTHLYHLILMDMGHPQARGGVCNTHVGKTPPTKQEKKIFWIRSLDLLGGSACYYTNLLGCRAGLWQGIANFHQHRFFLLTDSIHFNNFWKITAKNSPWSKCSKIGPVGAKSSKKKNQNQKCSGCHLCT